MYKVAFASIFPFLMFCLGYVFLYQIFGKTHNFTPNLIGISLQEAAQKASESNCAIQIIKRQHNTKVSHGTVLAQYPAPESSIRENHVIGLVIASPPPPAITPQLINTKTIELTTKFPEWRIQICSVPSMNGQTDSCIGQTPYANNPNETQTAIAYIPEQMQPIIVVPNLYKKRYCEIRDILGQYNTIQVTVLQEKQNSCTHQECACRIQQQYPMAHSLLDLNKPCTIELFIDR